LAERFRALFGGSPKLYRAPGRVNLIGEHTDYNDGFVMPAAIDFSCFVAAAPRSDRKLAFHSENLAQTFEADLSAVPLRPSKSWSDYPLGVTAALEEAGFKLGGANLLVASDIPLGVGLSSSAAIEVATAIALLDLSGQTIDSVRLARLCQRAENDFVGARVGIMDQFISLHGQPSRALKLDCRSLAFESLPLPSSVRLVICNTSVKHQLASGEYNRRPAECEEAVRLLSSVLPGITALRDVSPAQLQQHRGLLPEIVYRRALHVVMENARVENAARALLSGDLSTFGRLMGESHASLRDLYQVSCMELDRMVEIAYLQTGVYGARMTGGGFGGCTINLVGAPYVDAFVRKVGAAYFDSVGIRPEIYVCTAAGGAGPVTGF
jgi:galactokinase